MPVESSTDIGTLIVRSAGKGVGRPTLSPSGVSVRRIVILTGEGLCPEEIVAQMAHVSMAEVYAALSYYWANKAEIDEDIVGDEIFYQQLLESTRDAGTRSS